jgi:hypothetical protein
MSTVPTCAAVDGVCVPDTYRDTLAHCLFAVQGELNRARKALNMEEVFHG